MLKYSRESDDRSFEGPLIRVSTSAEEFTKIPQLHINMQQKNEILTYLPETLRNTFSTRYIENIVGDQKKCAQTSPKIVEYKKGIIKHSFLQNIIKNKKICLRPEYTICDIRPIRTSDDQRDQMANTTLFLARSSVLDHTSAASIDYTHLFCAALTTTCDQRPRPPDHQICL